MFKRLEYLERIVRNVAGHSAPMDLQSLKTLAEDVGAQHAPADMSSQSSEFDGVDEKFSIQPLQDNVTHYSGEFSHWNFSMRIKDWIEKTAPNHGSHARLSCAYLEVVSQS
jgi:hypothetical protein